MELPLLQDIVIILGLSVLIILVFQKLKLPPILGFLLTGVITGPYGLSLIKASHEVELLSEIGVIFLLFVIGIEFSLKGLSSIKYTVIWGGLLQVGLTIIAVAAGVQLAGLPLKEAVFIGFMLSLSSTAIVLKVLQERGEITAPHGRIAVAILIFQDIIVVPMMLVTPLLSGVSDNLLHTVLLLLAKVVGVVVVIGLLAKYIVPVILNMVVKAKSRELFILTVVVICFSTAWLTSSLGLSLALGAFFAGLIISESEYSHQATANILPFKEIFISFFFVSVGMLLNLRFFIDNIILIHLLALAIMLLKVLIAAIAIAVLRYPARTVLLAAFSIFQVGEFALLLSETGIEYGLLSDSTYQYFLSVSIISMGITPFMINYAQAITSFLIRAPLPEQVKKRFANYASSNMKQGNIQHDHNDHLVIIGYGINGKNVAKAARQANIPYVIIELDPDIIRKARSEHEPVIFGDASDETILKHINIQRARVVVIAISDPESTKHIVSSVRRFTATAYIIVRTRYLKEIEENLKKGADEVIPEEFETSIEIFTRVLKKYLVPYDEIQSFIQNIRSYNYDLLRNTGGIKTPSGIQLNIPDMEITTIPVQQGQNKIVGKKISETELRTIYGVNVLAIKRGDQYITHISPDTSIEQDDILYLSGNHENISRINEFFKF